MSPYVFVSGWRNDGPTIKVLTDGPFFFSSRRRHTRCSRDWSSDVCSSDLANIGAEACVVADGASDALEQWRIEHGGEGNAVGEDGAALDAVEGFGADVASRSGERRGGEEGRSRWVPGPLKKKKTVTHRE